MRFCEDEIVQEVIDRESVTEELLKSSDILMTLFHDRQQILARSKSGDDGQASTLRYYIDDKGVAFEFEAPRTVDGDKAVELVRSGDIDGCSFCFSTDYRDRKHVMRTVTYEGDKRVITYTVKKMTGIYDFTLTPYPAYEQTSCNLREAYDMDAAQAQGYKEQVKEMRNSIKQL